MLGLAFSSKLDWGSYIISIAATASKKIGALIRSMKFLSPMRLLRISINLPYAHVWNTNVTSGLVIQGVLKLFALNLVLTHLSNFFVVTKRISD